MTGALVWENLRDRGVLENRFARERWGEWIWLASDDELEAMLFFLRGLWN